MGPQPTSNSPLLTPDSTTISQKMATTTLLDLLNNKSPHTGVAGSVTPAPRLVTVLQAGASRECNPKNGSALLVTK